MVNAEYAKLCTVHFPSEGRAMKKVVGILAIGCVCATTGAVLLRAAGMPLWAYGYIAPPPATSDYSTKCTAARPVDCARGGTPPDDPSMMDRLRGKQGALNQAASAGVHAALSRFKISSNYGGIGGAVAGPVGAALGAEDGSGWRAAGGSLLGGAVGGAAGAGLGMLAHNPQAASLLALLGGTAGSGIGGHMGGAR